MIVVVKLSEWAVADGVSRQSACRRSCAGVLPGPAYQLSTGTILLEENEPPGRCGLVCPGVFGGSAVRSGPAGGPSCRTAARESLAASSASWYSSRDRSATSC